MVLGKLATRNASGDDRITTPTDVSHPKDNVSHMSGSNQDNPRFTGAASAVDVSNTQSQLGLPNQYEMLIRPGSESVTDDAVLLSTPYIVNSRHQILICVDCKHGVEPQAASSHLRQCHPHCRPSRALVAQLKRRYPELCSEKKAPNDQEPVFGLAVPLEKYVICVRCQHGYKNTASWRSHFCKQPGAILNDQSPYYMSHVQTFFRGNMLRYFPIRTPVSKVHDTGIDDFQLFQSQYLHSHGGVDLEPVEPEDYRELNQFLAKEGWLAHVAGHPISELYALVTLPRHDDTLSPIASEVLVLMSNVQNVIANAGFHVRRLLGRRPS